jgi:hypothetical protein
MIWVYPHDLGHLHMLKLDSQQVGWSVPSTSHNFDAVVKWDSLGRQRKLGPEIISFEHASFEPGGSLNPRMSTRKS